MREILNCSGYTKSFRAQTNTKVNIPLESGQTQIQESFWDHRLGSCCAILICWLHLNEAKVVTTTFCRLQMKEEEIFNKKG